MAQSVIPHDFLRVATCGRAVGLKGEIALWPISNINERFGVGSQLCLETGVTVTIVSSRTHKDHFIVRFDGCSSRNESEELVNLDVYAAPLESDALLPGEYFAHDIVGKIVVETNGVQRGKVVAFVENPASDLMETEHGVLVPFRFIVSVDDQHVRVDAPEGLFDVNDKDFL